MTTEPDRLDSEAPSTIATAVADPPEPPAEPPAKATGSGPAPKRRGCLPWVIGVLAAALVIGALTGVVIWALGRGAKPIAFSSYGAGFDSAMAKAGTTAAFPNAPVELALVSAGGSHPFSATFSAEEITALVNVFRWTTDLQGTQVAVSGVTIGFPSAGNARIRAQARVNGSSYSGELEGPVEYRGGMITSPGAKSVTAEGISIGGDRAKQATDMLIVYLNAYLQAAPGLRVDSAEITTDGVRVSGTAPDSLSLP